MRFKIMCIVALLMALGAGTSFAQEEGASGKETTAPKQSIDYADRDAQPIIPPDTKPIVRAMQKINRSGKCEVFLDVDPEGKPMNIVGQCDRSGYVAAVEKAMEKARFAPKIIDNKPVIRTGVVYPFNLAMKLQNAPEKFPKCAKQKTSKSELRQLHAVRDAVNAKDRSALEVGLQKIKRNKIFCPQLAMLDIYLVREHVQNGEWDKAQSLLDNVKTYGDARINDTVVNAYVRLHQQWVSDLDAIKIGLQTENRDAQFLMPVCMGDIYEAHEEHKVDDTCAIQFDLDDVGLVSKIDAACKVPEYVEITKQAARCMVFLPAIENGEAAPSLGKIAKLVFEKQPKSGN